MNDSHTLIPMGEREAVRVYEGAPRACKLTAAEREKLARAASRAR